MPNIFQKARYRYQISALLTVVFLYFFWPSISVAQAIYDIKQVTSDLTDHKWPSLNNNGDIVWSQKDANEFWQVVKCVPSNGACTNANTIQISTGDRHHERPVISDDGTIAWFQNNSGGGRGYQAIRRDPSGAESVLEFSTSSGGSERIAGKTVGISSDGHTISYYTFTGTGTRRFNVSGIGELTDGASGRGNFIGYGDPDINNDLAIVYAEKTFLDDPIPLGGIYKATTAQPFARQFIGNGCFPRIADGANPEIVYVKGSQILSSVHGIVDDGQWADINQPGDVIFEKDVAGTPQIFLARRRARIQLIDPIPELLDSAAPLGISEDVNEIRQASQVVAGVAADGAARLLVRIPAAFVGETLTVDLLTAEPGNTGNRPAPSHDVGSLGTSGGSSETVVASAANDGSVIAWVIYNAPRDFVRTLWQQQDAALNERQVTLRVESATRGLVGELAIKIVRPQVALIHGVWSDFSTWFNFSPLYDSPVFHDPRFFIGLIDYESTNASSFVTNAQVAKTQLRQDLDYFKMAQQVAAVRFDVVAHSMGGLVTRTIVDLPDYRRPENYMRGDVHKLITIDSPHAGTELAPRLLASGQVCKFFWGQFGQTVSAAGAVGDLVPGSLALFRLTDQRLPDYPQVPAHVIAGVASLSQTLEAETAYSDGPIHWICPTLLPNGGYLAVFGGENDLLVGLDSMLAFDMGLGTPLTVSGIGEIPSSGFFDFIHTVNPTLFPVGPDVLGRELVNGMIATYADRRIQLRVIQLLNEPSYGSLFESIRPGGL